MRPDEMLVDVAFPAMKMNQRGTFIKLGLRRAQAISLVDVAVILTMDEGEVTNASLTLGAVTPTICHATEAEAYLIGRTLNDETIRQAAELGTRSASPIDDVRGSAAYRNEMVRVCIARGLRALAVGKERDGFPGSPVLLWGTTSDGEPEPINALTTHKMDEPIVTQINGQRYSFTEGHNKTLLRLLREDAGLIGTKEGCSEGECGACTVFLDGMAVMSCLVPAPRAHGAKIVTIEGLADQGHLHPVQKTFIEEGAVQCGYCTPGFLMSAAKLLEERPQPTRAEVDQAITGNLCRCTGYYAIIQAIEKAGMEVPNE